MVDIPLFTNKTTPQRIAGVTSKIPNISKAAVLPGKAIQNLGNTLLKSATQDYKNKLDFENKKLKQQTDFENKTYNLEKQKELQTYKQNENFKTTVDQLEQEADTKFQIAALRITQKKNVVNTINELENFSNEKKYELATSSDLNDVDGFQKILTDKANSYKFNDDATKILFDNEYAKLLQSESFNVRKTIRQNIIDVGVDTFNNTINDSIYKAVYGNDHDRVKAFDYLFGTSGVVKEMDDAGLVVNPEITTDKIRKMYGSVLFEKMVEEEPQKFLNYLDKENYQDELSKFLTPDQIINFQKVAQNNVDSELRSQIQTVKSISTDIKTQLKDQEWIINNTTRGNLPILESLLEQAENLSLPGSEEVFDPALVQDIQNLISLVDVVDDFKVLNSEQQKSIIQEVESNQNALVSDDDDLTNISRIEATKLEIFKKIQSDVAKNIDDDAITMANKYGVIDNIERVDFGADLSSEEGVEAFFTQVDKSIDQSLKVQAHYNLSSPQFFTKETAELLSDQIANANGPDEIYQMAQMINGAYREHSLDAFQQLSKEAPLLAEIGGHINNGNEKFALNIAKGMMLEDEVFIPEFENSFAFKQIFTQTFGDSLNDNPQTLQTKINSINKVIGVIGLDQGWYNKNKTSENIISGNKPAIMQIMEESVGAIYNGDGKKITGGTIEWMDKKVILPPNMMTQGMSNRDFEKLINKQLVDNPNANALLEKAGGNRGLPVASPFINETEQQEIQLNSKEIFGGSAPYFWDQIGPGLYLLSLFDPNDKPINPEYINYAGTNEPFIFDLGSIVNDIQ